MLTSGAQVRRSTMEAGKVRVAADMSDWICPESPAGIRKLFDRISRYYDFANQVLSFGLQHRWRSKLLGALPQGKFARVLDVCTGTGALLGGLRERAEFVCGIDFSWQMLRDGRKVPGASLLQGDALRLPFADASFDVLTAAFGVRSFESLSAGLGEMRRVLKPGGMLAVLEFGRPRAWCWKVAFSIYARLVIPLLGGLISGDRKAYAYLTESVLAFPCGEDFAAVLEKVGFGEVAIGVLSGGIVYLYTAGREQRGGNLI